MPHRPCHDGPPRSAALASRRRRCHPAATACTGGDGARRDAWAKTGLSGCKVVITALGRSTTR